LTLEHQCYTKCSSLPNLFRDTFLARRLWRIACQFIFSPHWNACQGSRSASRMWRLKPRIDSWDIWQFCENSNEKSRARWLHKISFPFQWRISRDFVLWSNDEQHICVTEKACRSMLGIRENELSPVLDARMIRDYSDVDRATSALTEVWSYALQRHEVMQTRVLSEVPIYTVEGTRSNAMSSVLQMPLSLNFGVPSWSFVLPTDVNYIEQGKYHQFEESESTVGSAAVYQRPHTIWLEKGI
jgi:hypothetical protein